MTAKIEDEHIEAGIGERGSETVVATRAEIATIGHHRVQTQDHAAARADGSNAIDRETYAVGRDRFERRERHRS